MSSTEWSNARRSAVATAAVSAFVGLATLGVLAPATASASSATTSSPAHLLAATLRAANAQRSVVSRAATTVFGITVTAVATSGPTSGVARVSASGHSGEIRDLGSVVYAKFDAALVNFEFHTSVTSVANEWIAVPRSSHYFANLALGVTLPSVLSELTPLGPLHVSTTTWHGARVLALSGRANATLGVPGGSQTLFVAASAPYLPVGGAVHATESGVSLDVTIELSQWNVGLRVSAPAHSTPIAATALK